MLYLTDGDNIFSGVLDTASVEVQRLSAAKEELWHTRCDALETGMATGTSLLLPTVVSLSELETAWKEEEGERAGAAQATADADVLEGTLLVATKHGLDVHVGRFVTLTKAVASVHQIYRNDCYPTTNKNNFVQCDK
eukprot:COSAG05_NODE_1074_length_5958_cov_5.368152_2_plen_137_part_00